ncbi:MAG TPA: DUF1015 domain-containing protein [Polyangiaceae bacterium]|jgi:uncharacterized protein (DUF1015 family)|nr:DUF1015 domain-containing protein [Polyangiaceae bacterium]
MADIAPLKPLRYAPAILEKVVAPPYDVIDAELRARLGARHPENVVHVDLPSGEGDARYTHARDLFESWQARGVLVRDEVPAYYRYSQNFEPPGGGARITRNGFFALVRAVPYSERQVLPHERTLTGPKVDRIALSRATRAILSPQFMLYSDPERRLDAELDSGTELASFRTDDGIEHRLSKVQEANAVSRITAALRSTALLIADGHHRYETAVSLAKEFDDEARASGRTPSPRGEHLYTFAMLANGDDPELVVFATHRLVHSLAQFDFESMLGAAASLFEVRRITGGLDAARDALARERRPAICAVVKGGGAALLVLREDVDLGRHPVLGKRPEVLRTAAVSLLHDGVLEHLLGITPEAQAAKTNIRYLQDPRQAEGQLERGEANVLFLMNPTPVSTVRKIAEAGEVMPQKSTFFYPKVPSGLLFHTLATEREVG